MSYIAPSWCANKHIGCTRVVVMLVLIVRLF